MRRGTRTGALLALVTAAAVAAGSAGGHGMAGHRGGTLKLLARAAGGTIDPHVNYTLQYWQLYQATYDGLLAFTKAGGDAAFDVVPDLATAIPKPTDGGRTWKFTLRKGIKFSNGQPVTPADVVASFQRIFKASSPTAGSFYNVIVGADKCLKAAATCTLKGGIEAKGNTITFHLTRGDAEFPYKLAVPHASILPKGT